MKKNHVTGSLSKSGKKYRAFIRVTDKNGKTRQIGKTLDVEYKKGNKREAEKKLRQLMESYENKVQIDHSIREFVAFLKWYVELHSQKFSLKTSENYRSILNAHLIPYFSEKSILLENLTTGDLEEYFIVKGKKTYLQRH